MLCLCGAVSLTLLIYPLWIVQPFKYQAPVDLQRALFVFRVAPATSLAAAVIALAAAVFSWNGLRIRSRVLVSLLLGLVCAVAVLVRINLFEQLFHPAGAPQFLSVRNAKLDGSDMLITVAWNGEAHAYPIREMGYHHVVNDFVGGRPVVATY